MLAEIRVHHQHGWPVSGSSVDTDGIARENSRTQIVWFGHQLHLNAIRHGYFSQLGNRRLSIWQAVDVRFQGFQKRSWIVPGNPDGHVISGKESLVVIHHIFSSDVGKPR